MSLTGFEQRGRTYSLFDGLSDLQMTRLLGYVETRRFLRGDSLIVEGAVDRTLYVLTRGEVNILSDDIATGGQRLVAVMPTGTPFGEMAFFDKLPRSASVVAATDGEVLQLRFSAFERMCDAEPDLGLALVMELGRKVSVLVRAADAVAAPAIE